MIQNVSAFQGDEKKRVTQFHFTAWPDCRVPEDVDTLLEFRNIVINDIGSEEGPIVVHCRWPILKKKIEKKWEKYMTYEREKDK